MKTLSGLLLVLSVGLLISFRGTSAALGFDISVSLLNSQWACLQTHENGYEYAIVRVYRNIGVVDEASAQSIITASSLGFSVDAYFFPCLQNSKYSQDHGITCPTAAQQVRDTIQYLELHGIHHKSNIGNHLTSAVYIGRIWLDIEDGNQYFDSSTSANQNFIADIVSNFTFFGLELGIYTSPAYWQSIMGDINGYGNLPLWYPCYDSINSMDFFVPFADWTFVTVKQTGGNTGICGVSQIDSDFSDFF
jgi:hypothetical protein